MAGFPQEHKGFALIPIVIMVIAVAGFSFMAYLVYQNSHVNDFVDNPALPPVQHVAKNVNTAAAPSEITENEQDGGGTLQRIGTNGSETAPKTLPTITVGATQAAD